MALSSLNAVQSKTGSVIGATSAEVSLDAGTTAGSTVIIELYPGNPTLMSSGMAGAIPDGFQYDACSVDLTLFPMLYAFRKPNVAAGEGVAGSTGWTFSASITAPWIWRVTEWDQALEPVYPLEAVSAAQVSGTSPTSLSTGNAPAGGNSGRSDLVGLGWHVWYRGSNTTQTFDWSGHTNGFTERDELRITSGTSEMDHCWSWGFSNVAAQLETTATINHGGTRNAGDLYVALLVVYAGTTYS